MYFVIQSTLLEMAAFLMQNVIDRETSAGAVLQCPNHALSPARQDGMQ
jgi:hypothetical protein